MDVPELILSIGKLLLRRDLIRCIHVCKSWHRALAPLLYDTIHDLDQGKRPSIQAVERYGEYIRSLHLSMKNFNRVTLYRAPFRSNRCRNLQELVLHVHKDPEDTLQEWYIVDMVKRNPGLLRLVINCNDALLYDRLTWGLIISEYGRALREISFHGIILSRQAMAAIYALGPRLCKLEMIGCKKEMTLDDMIIQDPHLQFPNLTEFAVDDTDGVFDLEQLVDLCPNLHTLKWMSRDVEIGGQDNNFPVQEGFNAPVQENLDLSRDEFEIWAQAPIWSNIQCIDLKSLRTDQQDGPLTDSSVSLILDECAPLRKLTINARQLWARFFNSLERHYETLEHIEFPPTCSKDFPGWLWQVILTSSPRLTFFMAGQLNACLLEANPASRNRRVLERLEEDRFNMQRIRREIARPIEFRPYDLWTWDEFKNDMDNFRPWVCHRLESLILHIGGMPLQLEARWDKQVFARISELKELKTLHVEQIGCTEGLNFSLISGLDQLKDLKKLQSVKIDEQSQWMNKADGLWMLEQWPDLDRDSQDLIKRVGRIDKDRMNAKEVFYEKLGARVKTRRPLERSIRTRWMRRRPFMRS